MHRTLLKIREMCQPIERKGLKLKGEQCILALSLNFLRIPKYSMLSDKKL
jgi:hypothetical protein